MLLPMKLPYHHPLYSNVNVCVAWMFLEGNSLKFYRFLLKLQFFEKYFLFLIFSMAIVLMIFVNSGGGHYWWIEHAPWNGLHLADIVFPSFLWIMGVCIPISVKSQLARGTTKWRICFRIIWVCIQT